jgi:hypothetical protein
MPEMTTLHRSRNWKIEVFGREHGMPHIHVSGPDFRATVSIVSGEIIAGKLPATTLKEVRSWLDQNREIALKLWQERNPNI